MVKEIGRRDFVKNMALTGAALAGAAALGGCSQSSASDSSSIKWDEETDVLVIGSGFAGCAAAIEAAMAGAQVKVLEKMDVTGGNSRICGGAMAVANSPLQEKEGIKDSPELLVEDMLKAGLGLNHVEKVRMIAEKSLETLQWTIDLKVEWSDQMMWPGGHAVMRTYRAANNSGSGILEPALAKLKELGVPVETNAKMARIICDENKRVQGVEVINSYKFSSDSGSGSRYIKAKKAVVLAGGGFGANVTLRTSQDPRLTEEIDCTNHPGCTGDALLEALRIDALPVHLSWIQLGPWASPDEKGFGLTPFFSTLEGAQWGIMVDPATGKRIINEMGDRKQKSDAILATGHAAVMFVDSVGIQTVQEGVVDKILNKTMWKFDSLDELASHFEIPADALKQEVARYNSFVANGEDLDFHKQTIKMATLIEKPPFYAVRLWPKVHHCMGGVMTDLECKVMDLNLEVIKGLYAAGEIAGGTHGACRVGSCAILDSLVCGRVAGTCAAKEEAWA
ncbi:flavocytochrome c flavin subunit [hydrocarbon metagenome]|uniref:Flavocytochrome c flavin subunit n=1 Tax=hydrocarbon metagenome TaxID=938273 RepID=A0A0W8E4Y9_9ZZZZ